MAESARADLPRSGGAGEAAAEVEKRHGKFEHRFPMCGMFENRAVFPFYYARALTLAGSVALGCGWLFLGAPFIGVSFRTV